MAMSKLFSFSHTLPNISLASDIRPRRTCFVLRGRTWSTVVLSMSTNNTASIPIMVNSCNGQMGKAVIKAADSAGLQILPVSIGSVKESGNTIQVCGKKMQMLGTKDRESVLASLFDEHPNLIVVDFTVPAAVNDNADLYCKIGVPFVMGTTGGDRNRLYKTVKNSQVYAVISPQMGKPVVAFLAVMEYMAEKFPGVFYGYSLQVMESHQTGKLDTSGTAKAVISCFQRMGVSFDVDQVQSKAEKRIYNMIDVLQEGKMR